MYVSCSQLPDDVYVSCSQLLDVVYREETLFNVIKSVTKNWRSILLTTVLAVILIYLFSIIGYLLFQNDFIVEVEPVNESAPNQGNHWIASNNR